MTRVTEGEPVQRGAWKRVLNLITESRIPWFLLFVTVAMGLLSTKVSLLYPDYQMKITSGDLSRGTVTTAILILAASIVLYVLANFVRIYTRNLISKRVLDQVWAKILTLPIGIFHKTSPRELISRVTNDTQTLGTVFVTVVRGLVVDSYAVYLSLGYVFSYHKTLGWLQLALIPLIILIKFFQGRILFRRSYGLQGKLAELTKYLSQILINIPLVKVFVKEDHEIQRGSEVIKEYNQARFKLEAIQFVFTGVDTLMMVVNTILAVIVGVILIRSEQITLSTWIAFYLYSQSVYGAISGFLELWPLIKNTQGGVTRVADFMQADSEDYDGRAMTENVGDFVVEDLHFSYGKHPVLCGVSFTIPHNKLTAIVGRSGSGKTTILALLERLFTPDSGRITMDGVDIQSIALQEYRKNFAYMTQEKNLFRGTIRENLIYGIEREVTEKELILATRSAAIYDRIMEMPDGFETWVGEESSTLSGGESQRIALARLMLKEPKVLLLDEATANLDAESECTVMNSLRELYQGRTSVTVSHRLSTVLHADHIVMLEYGKVLAEGSHEDLMQNCSAYAKLVETELQTHEEERCK